MRNKLSLTPKTSTKLSLKKVLLFTVVGGGVLSIIIYSSLTFFGVIGKSTKAFAANSLGYSWDATITVDHTKVSGQADLIDFPLLVTLTNPNLRPITNGGRVESGNGFDIVFADLNDNLLDHQVESYNSSTGELIAWVRIPVLSATSNTDLKMFYGNPAIVTDQSTQNVWNSRYEGVWHMSDNPSSGDLKDAAGTYDAQGYGSLSSNSLVAAKIGLGTSFNGTSDYYAIKTKKYNASGSVPNLTISGWFKTTFNHTSWSKNWSMLDYDRSEYFNVFVHGNGKVGFATRGSGANSGIDDFYVGNVGQYNDGNWHYVAAVYDGTNKYLYVDGTLMGTKSNAHNGTPLGRGTTRYGFIGDGSEASSFNGGRNNIYYQGQYDEIRIGHATHTADWIATEYNNQNDPGSFTSVSFGTSPLPVELVGFDVQLVDSRVEITWSTATEINNDFFTIEKSTDAINYEYLDEVTGAGNSNTLQEYSYVDDTFDGETAYYRLKQTDFDGEFVYYAPKSVSREGAGEESFNITSAQPNPFKSRFSLIIQSEEGGVADFSLSDLNGVQLFNSQIGINEGRTEFLFMQGSKLSSGTYIVRLTKDGKSVSYKVIKQ